MVCYHPLKGYRSREADPGTGKRRIVFDQKRGYPDMPVTLACGQCMGCRLERSRQWAIRCLHEASLHADNNFLTLTYNDEHLPESRSLDIRDFQLFMKRYRKYVAKARGAKIKMYYCGEYGPHTMRPHYHACIFGHDFDDKEVFKVNKRGERIYISPTLEKLWPLGFSTIGAVTFDSAAYVARYIMKKITGEKAEEHYEWVNPETGEVFQRVPEFNQSSNGIAKEWYNKYKGDVYPHDYVVVNGKKVRPPRYYNGLFEHEEPAEFRRIRNARVRNAKGHADNNTPDRLKVREKVQFERLKRLPRSDVE